MIICCNSIVDRRDHVQYLTVSKSYSDNCTCSFFCNERNCMMSLSDDKQADIIDASITTSRYLDDILNIRNSHLDNMVSQIYPTELQLNKANTSDTAALFFDLY